MQYTKHDWRNGIRIETSEVLQRMTVLVVAKGRFYQKSREMPINSTHCVKAHWRTQEFNGRAAAYLADAPNYLKYFRRGILSRRRVRPVGLRPVVPTYDS